MAAAPRSCLAARARQAPRRSCAQISVATREGRVLELAGDAQWP